STSRITSPPRPPLAPSGPPRGLNFSRCTETQPCPPFPALTCRVTSSTKSGMVLPVGHGPLTGGSVKRVSPGDNAKGGPVFPGPPTKTTTLVRGRLGHRNDVHCLSAAEVAERDLTADQREQRVVTTTAHVGARVEPCAALTNQDLAGVHALTTETLHAEALGIRVTTVPAGRSALLACHVSSLLLRRDTGDSHLGVLLAVSLALLVTGLVLVLDDVDLGAGDLTENFGGHGVAVQLVGL